MTSATAVRKVGRSRSSYADAAAALFGQSRRSTKTDPKTFLKQLRSESFSGKFQVRVSSIPGNSSGIANLTKLLRHGTFVCEGESVSVGDTAVFDVQSALDTDRKKTDPEQKGSDDPASIGELLEKCARFLTFSRIESPPIRVNESHRANWLIGFPRRAETKSASALQGVVNGEGRLSQLASRFLDQLTRNSELGSKTSEGVLQSIPPRGSVRPVVEENALFQTITVHGSLPEQLILQSAKDTVSDAFVIGDDELAFFIPQVTGVNRNRNRGKSVSSIRTKVMRLLPRKEEFGAVSIGVLDSGLSESVAISEFDKRPIFAAFNSKAGHRVVSGDGASFHDFLGGDRSSVYYSHGTAVAAILGSRSGIAPACNLAVAAIDFSQGVKPIAVQNAITWLATSAFGPDGLDILSLSLDARRQEGRPEEIDAFLTNFVQTLEIGGFHCFAAVGNSPAEGASHGTAAEPAARQQVNAVGAVDAAGELAHFSNYCAVGSKGFVPEYLALGCDVQAVDVKGRSRQVSGTSFATPIAAGVAALVLQAHSDPKSLGKIDLYTEMLRVGARRMIGKPPHQGYSMIVPK
jgi:hypothetical protein